MNKIRLKEKEANNWRYALTISRTGYIMSSTTNASRAAEFDEDMSEKTQSYYTKRQEKLKNKEKSVKNTFLDRDMQVEVF